MPLRLTQLAALNFDHKNQLLSSKTSNYWLSVIYHTQRAPHDHMQRLKQTLASKEGLTFTGIGLEKARSGGSGFWSPKKSRNRQTRAPVLAIQNKFGQKC